MTILLPTLAVAFAAFCVWLVVRVINRNERWAKGTLFVVLIVGGYAAVVMHEVQKPLPPFTFNTPK